MDDEHANLSAGVVVERSFWAGNSETGRFSPTTFFLAGIPF